MLSFTNYALLTISIEMLLWLDDALKKYQDGARFHRYVPNLDWEAMHRTHGMVRLGAHLLKDLAPGGTAETQAASEPVVNKASRIIRNLLNISEDDFNVSVPLTSYGVDSLSAARLSCVKSYWWIRHTQV
jgi:hypothetical protein